MKDPLHRRTRNCTSTTSDLLKDLDGRRIDPSSRKGSTYVFNTEGRTLFSKYASKIDLHIVPKLNSLGSALDTRQNFWKIQSISAKVINKK